MAMIDKIQGAVEKLTGDETRLNTVEITTLQQAYYNLQLGQVKIAFYLTQAQSPEVKTMLEGLRDDFVKPNLDKPRRILEKAQIPFWNADMEARANAIPKNVPMVLRDEEIVLDTVYSMQATITGLQGGALAAIRGDVRDYFLNSRDAAMDQWRKIGMTAMKVVPQSLPPTMSGVR